MTEMHVPVRALFVVDAPVERVQAVLARRAQLHRLVHNEWVRLFARDPETGAFYRFARGECFAVEIPRVGDMAELPIPFRQHLAYGLSIARHEDEVYW